MITKDFFDFLLPSKTIINYRPKVRYDTNNVIFRNVILYGFQGSGKTSGVNYIVYKAIKKYGEENVNARVSEDGNLSELLSFGLRPVLVNILFSDNTTLRKISKEELLSYFRIRHLFKERYGLSNGYILSLIALHRFHSIPVELRTTIDGIIVKDSSMNPYDRSILKKFIGDKVLQTIEKISVEREKKPELKKLAYFVGRSISGFITLPLARENYLKPAFDLREFVEELKKNKCSSS